MIDKVSGEDFVARQARVMIRSTLPRWLNGVVSATNHLKQSAEPSHRRAKSLRVHSDHVRIDRFIRKSGKTLLDSHRLLITVIGDDDWCRVVGIIIARKVDPVLTGCPAAGHGDIRRLACLVLLSTTNRSSPFECDASNRYKVIGSTKEENAVFHERDLGRHIEC